MRQIAYMTLVLTELCVDNVQLPTPALEGITVKREKIWTKATGRSESGLMNGNIIAIKDNIYLKWPLLTMEEVAIIESVASTADRPFVSVRYTDMTGTVRNIQAYFGTPTYTIYSYSNGIQYIKDVSVDVIER